MNYKDMTIPQLRALERKLAHDHHICSVAGLKVRKAEIEAESRAIRDEMNSRFPISKTFKQTDGEQ